MRHLAQSQGGWFGSYPQRGSCNPPGSSAQLLLDALVEARDIDDDALVRAAPDRLLLVVGLDLEYERAAVDPDQFGRRADAHSDRRGGEMADIEMDAETLMAIREQGVRLPPAPLPRSD